MGYWLGIDVGSTVTVAAVCRVGASAEVVALGEGSVGVPSVLFLGSAGEVVVGQAALDRVLSEPDRVVRGFVERVGDQVPMVCGGQAYTAAQLVAMVVGWVVERVASRLGGPAPGIVVTHPAGWGQYKCRVLAEALAAVGLAGVRLAAQPAAAVAAASVGSGAAVAVVDVGGSSCQATVVRPDAAGGCAVVGDAQVLAQLGGADFDDAVFGHLLAAVPALACLDEEDPATLAATVALRQACTRAKETLSADTEVSIPVRARGLDTAVRLHRAEFDELIRPQLGEVLELVHRALRSAALEPAELAAVLLVGGSARIPLLAQLVSTELGHPVTIDTDPATTLARGAATLARATATPPAPATPHAPDDQPEPTPAPQPAHRPQRPALTAIPLDVEPAEVQRRRTSSRRTTGLVLAGALALLTAAGVASIPFLMARSDTTNPSANAAPGDQRVSTTSTPAVPPAADSPSPQASAPLNDEISSGAAGSGGTVRTTTPSSGAANPAAAAARPDPAGAPASAPLPSWVSTYTWTSTWSSPPPPPTHTTTPPSPDPTSTTTTSAAPPTTSPAPTTVTITPPPKPSPSQHRRPTT